MIMSFTHDIPMPTFLPNVPPTGRSVMLPVVVVMGCQVDSGPQDRLRTDLVGPGLLAGPGRAAPRFPREPSLPVTGGAQARKVLDKDLPSNTLLKADQPGPPA
jgi:carboxymethylenebutenolidase